MMKIYVSGLFILILSSATVLFDSSHAEGIQIGRTRVIYDASKKETALPLINQDTELPWLIQSWVTLNDEKTSGPFIITPPLFRLDSKKEQSLRILWTGTGVPPDRESLFYLNIRTIPGSDKSNENQNVLRIIYKTRLKLFFRPKGLPGTPEEACQNLHFMQANNQLQITNNSAYHIVFDSLYVGNDQLHSADMTAPKSTTTLAISGNSPLISWRCLTDYGNASPKYTSRTDKG